MSRVLFLAGGILPVLFLSCINEKEQKKEVFTSPKAVKYAAIEQSGGIQERTYSGITQSASITDLSFRSGGLLVELNVRVGQRVKKGEVLARLDQKDAQLAYDQALVDVQNAKAQFDAASSSFDRVKQLYESNNASLSDYEAAKSQYSNAQSSYQISLKRLDLQKSKIDYLVISAPMEGIVSAINSEINEVVQSGRTIIVMSREGEEDIEIQVGIPERYIDEIHNGDKVGIQIGSIDDTYSGTVTEVGYASSNTGATYPVTVSLSAMGSSAIRPDMPCEVTFTFGSANQQSFLIAPIKAIAGGAEGNYAYRLVSSEEEGMYLAEKADVTLGDITKDGYIVLSGLNEGDRVAVAGLNSMYEGQKVMLLKE